MKNKTLVGLVLSLSLLNIIEAKTSDLNIKNNNQVSVSQDDVNQKENNKYLGKGSAYALIATAGFLALSAGAAWYAIKEEKRNKEKLKREKGNYNTPEFFR